MIEDPKPSLFERIRNWFYSLFRGDEKRKPLSNKYWTTEQVIAYGETLAGDEELEREIVLHEIIVHSPANFDKVVLYNSQARDMFDPVHEATGLEAGYRGMQLGSYIYVDNTPGAPAMRHFAVPKDFNPVVKEDNG